ncbi:MAG: kelch repeat-containing protein, partial [Bacteroidota bacterium]
GNGYDADGAFGQLNDLWRFSVSTGKWIWVGGSDKVNAQPVYGTLGVASVVNDPGARHAAISWTDNRGKFWMFGGQGYYSDLWQFDPAEGVWTWMGGSAVPNEPGVYGTLGASSTANRPGARAYGQGWTDALGNLWLFGGDGVDGYGNSGPLNDLWKFDTVRKDWTWMGGSDEKNKSGIYGVPGQQSAGNIPGSRRGSTGWRAANGDLWLFGGTSIGPDGFAERDDLWRIVLEKKVSVDPIFTWLAGTNTFNAPGVYESKGTPSPASYPGSRTVAAGWTDALGNFWMYGGARAKDNVGGYDLLDDLWRYTPGTGLWTWESGTSTGNQTPVYGLKGVAAQENRPGARLSSMSWIGSSGDLWIFGGGVFGSGESNDLWKYNVRTGLWTWLTGGSGASAGNYGIKGTGSPSAVPGARSLGAA